MDEFVADLSAQSEVRRLADEVMGRYPRIDVLVNNVGGFWNTRHVTADGLERTFALNHLAPFLLTNLLLDRLGQSTPSRVVTVSSNAQAMGRIDFDDLQGERSYSGARAYNQSKLANVLFTYELAKRLRGSGVTANALHPGVVRTSFGAEDPAGIQRLFLPLILPFMKTPAQGAATSIHLASAPELDHVTGRFFVNRKPRDRSSTATTKPPGRGSGRSAPSWSASPRRLSPLACSASSADPRLPMACWPSDDDTRDDRRRRAATLVVGPVACRRGLDFGLSDVRTAAPAVGLHRLGRESRRRASWSTATSERAWP